MTITITLTGDALASWQYANVSDFASLLGGGILLACLLFGMLREAFGKPHK